MAFNPVCHDIDECDVVLLFIFLFPPSSFTFCFFLDTPRNYSTFRSYQMETFGRRLLSVQSASILSDRIFNIFKLKAPTWLECENGFWCARAVRLDFICFRLQMPYHDRPFVNVNCSVVENCVVLYAARFSV